MTGNLTDAAHALANDLDVLSYAGTTRIVYKEGNVVYKVELGEEGEGVNAYEYERMTTVEPSPGVYFPDVTLYNVDGKDVLAMEFIAGQELAECYCIEGLEECTESCMPDWVWQLVNGTLDDTGGFNTILTEEGRIYIIDMG